MELGKRIQIIGMPRSGTTYITNLIYSHFLTHKFNVDLAGEPPNNSKNARIHYINDMLEKPQEHIMKLMTTDINSTINEIDYKKYRDKFYSIGILRKNLFNATVSYALGSQTQEFDNYTYDDTLRVEISVKNFIGRLREQLYAYESYQTLKALNYFNHELIYEDLTFIPVVDLYNIPHFKNRVSLLDQEHTSSTTRAPGKFKIITNTEELREVYKKYVQSPKRIKDIELEPNLFNIKLR